MCYTASTITLIGMLEKFIGVCYNDINTVYYIVW